MPRTDPETQSQGPQDLGTQEQKADVVDAHHAYRFAAPVTHRRQNPTSEPTAQSAPGMLPVLVPYWAAICW